VAFQPAILNPSPDPWFVRELKKIDTDLRVEWGYNRYFKQQWAIERRIPPERYFLQHQSLLSTDAPRFVDQPIFDTNQPICDENGEFISYRQVGSRKFDLAPEFEWVRFERELTSGVLSDIKRAYAWERNHPISRLAFEKAQEREQMEAAAKKKRMEVAVDGIDEVLLDARKKVQFGYGDTRNEK
jgi:hypothetical protein